MVVRRGMTIALAGIGTGVVGALALTRVMSTLLYDVAPRDPLTFTVVTAALATAALLACFSRKFGRDQLAKQHFVASTGSKIGLSISVV